MQGQESVGSLHDWVDAETRHVDVVASWESLCDTYDSLRFADQLSDAERLEEYRWIVQQMNSFLSKIRTKLMTCKDTEAMMDLLNVTYTPANQADLKTRKALVYQKLRQQWVKMAMTSLHMMMQEEQEERDGGDW